MSNVTAYTGFSSGRWNTTMASQLTAMITLVATSGVLTFFLCMYAWSKRKEITNSSTFILYMGALIIYIFAYAFQLASDSLEGIMRWTVVQYMGMAPAPALGLIFILRYFGKRLTLRAQGAMVAIPIVTIGMVATNHVHHLFYKSMFLRQDAPFVSADMVIGEWYIVHGIYTFSCMLFAVIFLARRWSGTKGIYRKQLATLILGQVLPIIAAFVYLIGLTPYGIDPVPLVLCVTSALYIWAILSSRMLTIVPIAKETIFDSMSEGVAVLDAAGRIIDTNRALSLMIPGLDQSCLGLTWEEAWIRLTGMILPVERGQDHLQGEVHWTIRGTEVYYHLRSSSVRGASGETMGNVWMVIDVTEQRRLQEQLKQMAYYDGLTGIYNRAQFIVQGKQLIVESGLADQPLSFILFDIDHFKGINDTYGHEAGDQALIHIVSIVKSRLPKEAIFGRFGGEEFAVALPGHTLQQGAEQAEALRAALEAEPLRLHHSMIAITASFGIAEYGRDDSLEAVYRKADQALYAAKHEGRNRVRCYNE